MEFPLGASSRPLVAGESKFFQGAFSRQFVENSMDCIAVLDLQGRLLYMNPRGQRMMEVDDFASQCLKMPWTAFWQGVGQQKIFEVIAEEKGGVGSFQAYGQTVKGTPKWWDVMVTPMLGSSGNLEHLLVIARDITARKHAEEEQLLLLAHEQAERTASEDARQRLYDIFMKSPAFMLVLRGPEYVIEFANETYYKIVGPGDTIGRSDAEVIPKLKNKSFLEALNRVYATGEPFTGNEVRAEVDRHNNGILEEGFFNLVFQPMRNTSGEIESILVHGIDVTEQVQSRQVLDRVFNLSLDLLCIIGFDGYFKKVNPSFTRLLGYSQEELQEQPYTFWLHPDDLNKTARMLAQLTKGLPTLYFENRLRAKDGSYKWIAWSESPVVEERLNYVVGRDITDFKEQEQLRETFMGIANHELRTPITAIKANLHLATRSIKKLLDTPQIVSSEGNAAMLDVLDLLAHMDHQIAVQARLINDLLDVSRIQIDKLRVSFDLCNVASILREAVDNSRSMAPLRKISLELPEEQVPVLALADADRIGQVLGNYLTNAFKYSEKTLPVVVGLNIEEHVARVWVRDYGPGLSKEAQKHIWERFYQVQSAKENYIPGGLGLGLYISQMLISQHGGEVGVESTPGHGSTFWFTLPLIEALESQQKQAQESKTNIGLIAQS